MRELIIEKSVQGNVLIFKGKSTFQCLMQTLEKSGKTLCAETADMKAVKERVLPRAVFHLWSDERADWLLNGLFHGGSCSVLVVPEHATKCSAPMAISQRLCAAGLYFIPSSESYIFIFLLHQLLFSRSLEEYLSTICATFIEQERRTFILPLPTLNTQWTH